MGQYKEWLHSLELDWQLRTQVKTLKNQISHLQARAVQLEPLLPTEQNTVIQALLAYAQAPIRSKEPLPIPSPTLSQSQWSPAFTQQATIEEELFEPTLTLKALRPTEVKHRGLLHRDKLVEPTSQPSQIPVPNSPLETPRLELNEEVKMRALLQIGSQEEIHLPWWLEQMMVNTQGTGPIDPETVRTNRLIQRWLTRWGQQVPAQEAHQKNSEEAPPL